MLTVGLNRAMHLIADKIANPKKGGRRFGADPGKALGDHPDKGGPIVVKNGRYGPYVSHNGVNATLTGRQDARYRDARRGGGPARRPRGHGRQFAERAPCRRPQDRHPASTRPSRQRRRRAPKKPAAAKPKKAATVAAKAKPARKRQGCRVASEARLSIITFCVISAFLAQE